jgi:tape measure domain-containing protein
MSKFAEAYVEIGAKLGSSSFAAAKSSVVSTMTSIGSEAASSLSGALTAGIAGLTGGGLLASLGLGVKLAADAETAQVAFSTIMGSAEQAKATLADLNEFAAKTPFEFPELRDASRALIAFGISGDQLIPTLTRIGDISSGLSIPIKDLAEIYGKARVQGRLMAEDINQLTGRGIPVIQEFAKQFGVSEGEVRKLVESGKVGFPQLEEAFRSLTSEGGKFYNMMAVQSETLAGKFSTFTDNVKAALKEAGQAAIEGLDFSGMLDSSTGFLEGVKENADGIKAVFEGIGVVVKSLAYAFEFVRGAITNSIAAMANLLAKMAAIMPGMKGFKEYTKALSEELNKTAAKETREVLHFWDEKPKTEAKPTPAKTNTEKTAGPAAGEVDWDNVEKLAAAWERTAAATGMSERQAAMFKTAAAELDRLSEGAGASLQELQTVAEGIRSGNMDFGQGIFAGFSDSAVAAMVHLQDIDDKLREIEKANALAEMGKKFEDELHRKALEAQGMGRAQIDAAMNGGDQKTLDLARQVDAADQRSKDRADAQRVKDQFADPYAKYEQELNRLKRLRESAPDMMDSVTFDRARGDAEKRAKSELGIPDQSKQRDVTASFSSFSGIMEKIQQEMTGKGEQDRLQQQANMHLSKLVALTEKMLNGRPQPQTTFASTLE